MKDGAARLVGVEYVTPAVAWDAGYAGADRPGFVPIEANPPLTSHGTTLSNTGLMVGFGLRSPVLIRVARWREKTGVTGGF